MGQRASSIATKRHAKAKDDEGDREGGKKREDQCGAGNVGHVNGTSVETVVTVKI